MALPNFVIAGAPKCGTTSLFDWLAAHPDVCASIAKEPFFLMDRDHPLRRRDCNFHDHGLDAYARIFRGNAEDCAVRMEGSTQYIYQQTALEVLPGLPSRPRVLFLVRRPADHVYSMFSYYKMKGHIRQDLPFDEFVERLAGRWNTDADPAWTSKSSRYLLAREMAYCRYVDYLTRWRDRLGPDRMRVVLFETMRADPRATVQGVCDWLGIDKGFYDDFEFQPRNRTSAVRSASVQKVAGPFARVIRPGPVKEMLKRLYYSVQATKSRPGRSEEDEAAMAGLDAQFRPANEKLAREFGLDLSAWG